MEFRNHFKKTIFLLGILPCFCSLALAVFDHPVGWNDMSDLDLAPVFKSRYGSESNLMEPVISEAFFGLVLHDREERIHPDFKIPRSLEAPVRFWLRIYTEFTTQHVVIFDEYHPDLIYEVLDFRPLFKKARNEIAYEVMRNKKVANTLRAYQQAFQRLIKNPKPRRPSFIEARILETMQRSSHRHSIQKFAQSIRTQTGQRDNIIKGLLAAELYFPKMEEIFLAIGVPSELTRMSLVESSFNLRAVSYAGAMGVWQFLRRSALEYLVIDKKLGVDERLSPLKSTIAAAKLLKRNYRILKSWPLAITSYNHGIRSLRQVAALPKNDLFYKNLFKSCSSKSSLGWASRNYYSEFLALLYAEKYRYLFYGVPPLLRQHPLAFYRLEVPETPLKIALRKGISIHEFGFLNPDIRSLKTKLPKGFWVALPVQEDQLKVLLQRKVALINSQQ